jgi:hypothetical protein
LFPVEASNAQLITAVYRNSFGRDPDGPGYDYWMKRLGALDPRSGEYLNERGSFIGELILGAYATTSGEEDRTLLTNKHDVALYYVNRLSAAPAEDFDKSIDALLILVSGDPATRDKARQVIDYVFANPVTLTEVMSNAGLLATLWAEK